MILKDLLRSSQSVIDHEQRHPWFVWRTDPGSPGEGLFARRIEVRDSLGSFGDEIAGAESNAMAAFPANNRFDRDDVILRGRARSNGWDVLLSIVAGVLERRVKVSHDREPT